MLTRTRLALTATAVAVALPATFALSQSGQNQGQTDRPPQQQQNQQPPRQLNGLQGQQLSPEQAKQMAQKWFEHAASANQFEIESAKLASERFGGQGAQQPGQQPGQRPGQGDGMGQDPGARSGSGQADPQQRDPELAGAQVGQRQGGMQAQQQQQLAQAAQMIQRDHEQAQQTLRQVAEQAGIQISETPELNEVHQAKLDMLRQKQGEEFARAWVFGNMGGHTAAILECSWASNNGPTPEVKEYAGQILPKLQQHAQQLAPIAYQLAGIESARTAGERMGGDQPQPGQGNRPGSGGAGGAGGGGAGGAGGAGGTDRPDA